MFHALSLSTSGNNGSLPLSAPILRWSRMSRHPKLLSPTFPTLLIISSEMYSFRLPVPLLLIISAITLVSASPAKRQQFSVCGLSCLLREQSDNTVNFGTCTTTDFSCLCNFQPFVQSAINCISTRCSGSEQVTQYTQLELRCLQAGVPVLPPATTPGITESITRTVIDVPTSTATGTSTATSTSPPSSSPPSTTSLSSTAHVLSYWSIAPLLGAFLSMATLLA